MVFFCFSIFFSCIEQKVVPVKAVVNYDGADALNVTFESDKDIKDIHFFLQGKNEPILGDFEQAHHTILFRPIVPFTKGKTYEIKYRQEIIGMFDVEASKTNDNPMLTAIFPSTDTVPENLLKMYFVFSKPMQEVQNALEFIEVYNLTDHVATSIFLELQNELWNEDHTELTLWLDPGRIKTDLVPNRNQGLPLEEGKEYEIRISSKWYDAQNNLLDKNYTKHIYVSKKDRIQLALDQWTVKTSKSGTRDPIFLNVNEPLDAMLALETVLIYDANNSIVQGDFKLIDHEKRLLFTPSEPWKPGTYSISIRSILEDLAGNNLNHLFDVDLQQKKNNTEYTEHKELSFKVL